jgi:DNA-binding MarR family transcriptional regulator
MSLRDLSRRGDMAGRKQRDVNEAEYQALAEFRFALRSFLVFSETAAEAAGLTPQQHQALLAIKGYPGRDQVTVSELAERLLIRHHSAVELIDRLSRGGLIVRKPDPVDRRRVYISLTPKATRKLRTLSAAHLEELRQLGSVLPGLLERLGMRG